MNHQEIYKEALHFIEGSGGYPKNEKKGYKRMKEAADAGNTAASVKYASYLLKKAKYMDALIYFEKNNAYNEAPKDFVTCLYYCALKNKSNLPRLQFYYNWAVNVRDKLHGNSYYYFARLAKMSGQDDSVYKEALYYAALGGSDAMPDKEYRLIDRERGVVYGGDEVSLYIQANYSGKDEEYFGGFLPCKQTEQSAWNVAKANLSRKGIKGKFAFRKAAPKGILEYQPIICSRIHVGTVACKFKYDNPNYSTVNTGSSSYTINRDWSNYYAGFRSQHRQDQLSSQFIGASFTKSVPNARVRVSVPRWKEVMDASFEKTKAGATAGSRSYFKSAVASNYNWEEKYVTVDFADTDQTLKDIKLYFVPFWFFTVNLPFGQTATARVNGATGEVDFFSNNPFGLFTIYDDVTVGANTLYSKERRKVLRKTTPEYKRRKKHLLHWAIHVALLPIIFGILAALNDAATLLSLLILFLAFLSYIVHIVYSLSWLIPKRIREDLSDKIQTAIVAKKKKANEEKQAAAAAQKAAATEQKTATADKNETDTQKKTEDEEKQEDDEIITLTGKDGEEIDFVEIAGIAYQDNFYAILQPAELPDGMTDDEALVFRVTKNADDDTNYEIETDDNIIEAVFAEYHKLCDEEMAKND